MVMEPEAVKEFTDIYEKECGIRLPYSEAKLKATWLMRVYARAIFLQEKEINDNDERE